MHGMPRLTIKWSSKNFILKANILQFESIVIKMVLNKL